MEDWNSNSLWRVSQSRWDRKRWVYFLCSPQVDWTNGTSVMKLDAIELLLLLTVLLYCAKYMVIRTLLLGLVLSFSCTTTPLKPVPKQCEDSCQAVLDARDDTMKSSELYAWDLLTSQHVITTTRTSPRSQWRDESLLLRLREQINARRILIYLYAFTQSLVFFIYYPHLMSIWRSPRAEAINVPAQFTFFCIGAI